MDPVQKKIIDLLGHQVALSKRIEGKCDALLADRAPAQGPEVLAAMQKACFDSAAALNTASEDVEETLEEAKEELKARGALASEMTKATEVLKRVGREFSFKIWAQTLGAALLVALVLGGVSAWAIYRHGEMEGVSQSAEKWEYDALRWKAQDATIQTLDEEEQLLWGEALKCLEQEKEGCLGKATKSGSKRTKPKPSRRSKRSKK